MPLMDPLSALWYPVDAFDQVGISGDDLTKFLKAPSVAKAQVIDGLSLGALAIPGSEVSTKLDEMWIQLRKLLADDNFNANVIGANVPSSEGWDVDTPLGSIASFIFRKYNPNTLSFDAVLTPNR